MSLTISVEYICQFLLAMLGVHGFYRSRNLARRHVRRRWRRSRVQTSERGGEDGVLVLGHAHQRRLHRVVLLHGLPAAIREKKGTITISSCSRERPALEVGTPLDLLVSADEVVDEDADLELGEAHARAHPWPAAEPQEAVRLERALHPDCIVFSSAKELRPCCAS